MGNEISVLIADDNIEFGNLLNEYMEREEDIHVVGVARDGLQAVEMISSLRPEVVILDIIMPNLDGIGVLEKIISQELSYKPLFIMLSAIGQDKFIQKAIALGAEYYIIKPFALDILASRVRQMHKDKYMSLFTQNKFVNGISTQKTERNDKLRDVEFEVAALMREAGIPPHMAGYQFLKEAIIEALDNPKSFTSITKILYPSVARKFNSTPQKVERAMRNAIESAWARGNPDSIDSLFGYTVNYDRGKPTNSEFIAMMVDRARINLSL